MTERRQGGTLCMQSGNPQSSLQHILVQSLPCPRAVTCTSVSLSLQPTHMSTLSFNGGASVQGCGASTVLATLPFLSHHACMCAGMWWQRRWSW